MLNGEFLIDMACDFNAIASCPLPIVYCLQTTDYELPTPISRLTSPASCLFTDARILANA